MILAASELTITRGDAPVLRDVSAALRPGEVTAIVGPNGAGKSSLLMALAGLLVPSAGAVSLDGEALAALHPTQRAKAIGYLPQEADVAWDVSVEALVALGRLPHRDSRREPVSAALDALGLNDLAHRPVSRLSGGERARVLLARVLAGEPRWILADEPFAALDLAHQHGLIGHLKRCASNGAGVVIVVHDLATAMNHADRVLVLSEGRLAADAPACDALSGATISRVWGVETQWLGNPGQHALVTLGGE